MYVNCSLFSLTYLIFSLQQFRRTILDICKKTAAVQKALLGLLSYPPLGIWLGIPPKPPKAPKPKTPSNAMQFIANAKHLQLNCVWELMSPI